MKERLRVTIVLWGSWWERYKMYIYIYDRLVDTDIGCCVCFFNVC